MSKIGNKIMKAIALAVQKRDSDIYSKTLDVVDEYGFIHTHQILDILQGRETEKTTWVKNLLQQEREEGGYLNYFSYDDWKIGEDDKLRVGDYIYSNHQSPHDGYEREIEGKIVLHQTNDLPVMLFNFKIDEDGEEIGDYADLQELMMQGWTFTRLESIKAINQDHE